MNHDTHDDGLVHPHNWATEPPVAMTGRSRLVAAAGARPPVPQGTHDHDDGLVHGHGWASSQAAPLG